MKKLLLCLLLSVMYLVARPQGNTNSPATEKSKLFFSLDYSYLDCDLKLLSLSKHSVWDGKDFGTTDLDQDQIDTLNSLINYNEKLQDLNLTAGVVILNNPDSPWYMDGQLIFGLVSRENSVVNKASDVTEQAFKSENFSPTFGIGFNFSYRLNDKWKLKLNTRSLYALGTTLEIEDNIFLQVPSLDEKREIKYKESYSRIDLLASYTINKLSFSAGPGFYLLYNKHDYNIVRTNTEDGKVYEDTIETSMRTRTFINGSLIVGWKFSDHFMLRAAAGISNDIAATAGIVYSL
jgi:hypothetical protein